MSIKVGRNCLMKDICLFLRLMDLKIMLGNFVVEMLGCFDSLCENRVMPKLLYGWWRELVHIRL